MPDALAAPSLPLTHAAAAPDSAPLSRRRGPTRPTRSREIRHWKRGLRVVAGIDEVGRGPLAGPVTAAAVVLKPYGRPAWLAEVRDSKRLTPRTRERLATEIQASVSAWGVGWATAREIDDAGIVEATQRAMQRALDGLGIVPEFVLVDGRDRFKFACPSEQIIRGDGSVTSIAAASVVAKVARDALMSRLDVDFPAYGFASNKGYGTAAHLAALVREGPCAQHRYSFAPLRTVREALPAVVQLEF